MKQIVVLILVFFYSLSATNATVHFHFCQGETQSVSFDKQTKHKLDCKLCAKKSKSCHQKNSKTNTKPGCKDLSLDLKKVDDNHFSSDSSKVNPTISPAILVRHWVEVFHVLVNSTDSQKHKLTPILEISKNNAPPYLINCNFRI